MEDRDSNATRQPLVRAPVSDFAMHQVTARNNQNVLHLAAGPGDERLAFVVAFFDLVGFETGMHLAMQKQKDGVCRWRARAESAPPRRGAARRWCAATARASWHNSTRRAAWCHSSRHSLRRRRRPRARRRAMGGRRRRRRRADDGEAPSPDSSDGDDGDSSIEWGPVIPAPARRAPPRPIPEGKEIIEIE